MKLGEFSIGELQKENFQEWLWHSEENPVGPHPQFSAVSDVTESSPNIAPMDVSSPALPSENHLFTQPLYASTPTQTSLDVETSLPNTLRDTAAQISSCNSLTLETAQSISSPRAHYDPGGDISQVENVTVNAQLASSSGPCRIPNQSYAVDTDMFSSMCKSSNVDLASILDDVFGVSCPSDPALIPPLSQAEIELICGGSTDPLEGSSLRSPNFQTNGAIVPLSVDVGTGTALPEVPLLPGPGVSWTSPQRNLQPPVITNTPTVSSSQMNFQPFADRFTGGAHTSAIIPNDIQAGCDSQSTLAPITASLYLPCTTGPEELNWSSPPNPSVNSPARFFSTTHLGSSSFIDPATTSSIGLQQAASDPNLNTVPHGTGTQVFGQGISSEAFEMVTDPKSDNQPSVGLMMPSVVSDSMQCKCFVLGCLRKC